MITKNFLYAGKSEFVFRNPQGDNLTARVRQSKKSLAYYATVRYNNKPWAYIGMVPTDGSKIKLTPKSEILPKEQAILNYAIKIFHGNKPLPFGYQIHHTGRCGRCSRMLRDPISIAQGIGPECEKKLKY